MPELEGSFIVSGWTGPNDSFQPTDLGSELALWLRASDAVTTGSSPVYVASITDRANSIYMTAAGGVVSPVYFPTLINGQPGFYPTNSASASGPATSGSVSSLNIEHNQAAWIIAAIEYNPAGGAINGFNCMGALNAGESYRGWALDIGSSTSSGCVELRMMNAFNACECTARGSTVLTNGQRYIIQVVKDTSGTAAGTQIYINGVAETMVTVLDNLAGASTNGNAAFSLSALFSTLNVGWGDVLIANTTPSALDIADMDAFLNARYAAH